MEKVTYLTLLGIIACAATLNLFLIPKLIKLARIKDIVDTPGLRKVHVNPVAILGGLGIMLSVITSMLVFGLYAHKQVVVAMTVALLMGCMGLYDDITDMRASKKFLMEVVIGIVLFSLGFQFNTLHGIFGIDALPYGIAMALSVLAFVGICNAINLVDGVDGLLTGLCGFYATVLMLLFIQGNIVEYAMFAATITGAIIPAFIFNVFGTKNKLFMGDCGALFLGVVMYIFIVVGNSSVVTKVVPNLNPISLWISILSIPVMDTLRVMTMRMLKGRSPFSPDKTHLHHYLLRFHLSHRAVSFTILMLNIWALLSTVAISMFVQGTIQLVLVVLNVALTTYATPIFYYISIEQLAMPRVIRLVARLRLRRLLRANNKGGILHRLVK
ncbi:MAG: glycosyltransferase family 4 protein [Marinifilaceae bacterium]